MFFLCNTLHWFFSSFATHILFFRFYTIFFHPPSYHMYRNPTILWCETHIHTHAWFSTSSIYLPILGFPTQIYSNNTGLRERTGKPQGKDREGLMLLYMSQPRRRAWHSQQMFYCFGFHDPTPSKEIWGSPVVKLIRYNFPFWCFSWVRGFGKERRNKPGLGISSLTPTWCLSLLN